MPLDLRRTGPRSFSGDAGRCALVLSIAVGAVVASPAQADTWKRYTVSDRNRGVVGQGVEVVGSLKEDYGTRYGTLNADCVDNQTTVRVETRDSHFGTEPVRVRWSVDNGPEHVGKWDVCDNGRCIGLWDGQGVPFLKSLLGVNELRMTIGRYFAGPVKAIFLIEGSRDAIAIVGRRCGWMQ